MSILRNHLRYVGIYAKRKKYFKMHQTIDAIKVLLIKEDKNMAIQKPEALREQAKALLDQAHKGTIEEIRRLTPDEFWELKLAMIISLDEKADKIISALAKQEEDGLPNDREEPYLHAAIQQRLHKHFRRAGRCGRLRRYLEMNEITTHLNAIYRHLSRRIK